MKILVTGTAGFIGSMSKNSPKNMSIYEGTYALHVKNKLLMCLKKIELSLQTAQSFFVL